MSFSVSVVRPHVPVPIDVTAASEGEVDAWLDGTQAFLVFAAPVASDGMYFEYFARVASGLGLSLLARAYEHGLNLSTADELIGFLRELDLVEATWHQRDLLGQWQDDLRGPGRWARLLEGAAALRHAARLALDGRLTLHLG